MQAISFIKNIFVFLTVCVLTCMVPVEATAASRDYTAEIPDRFKMAAQNDQLRLYYNETSAEILVENKETGYMWDSALTKEEIQEESTDMQRAEMISLFSITYSNANDLSSTTSQTSLESEKYTMEIERIENGFIYHIYISDFDVRISIVFTLNEDGLEVTVPEDGIEETVESKENIESYCHAVDLVLQEMKEQFQTMKEDGNLTDSLRKKLNKSIETTEHMQKILNETTDPFGISSQCEKLLDDVEYIDKSMRGSSKTTGFYTSLLKSDELSDNEKEQYRTDMSELERLELSLNVQISQMQALSAAAVVNIKLMPYFGAQMDDSEGYMLYPDGCGALTYFKENHGSFSSCYQTDTYSPMSTDIEWETEKGGLGLTNQAIPYFGIKTGEDACISYVCQGQAQSNITFCPSGYVLPINRIGAGFTYRQTVATSSTNGEWQSGADMMIFQKKKMEYNASVQYMFLENDSADYNGMANVLRAYFQKQGILKQSDLVREDRFPLALDIFGGYKKDILFFHKYMTGTTLKDASAILDAFSDIPVLCNYMGLFEEGYGVYPTQYKLSGKLGDEQDLKKIAEKLQNMGGQLFIDSDQLFADYDQSGYANGDLVIGNNYQVLQNYQKTRYLFSPEIVKRINEERTVDMLGKYGNVGITEKMLGSFIFADFSENHFSSRMKTVEYWQQILRTDSEKLGAVAVNSGNDYTFSCADWLRKVPDDVSGYIYTDEAVPFYSMLVHGFAVYTSNPNNQFYNTKTQVLKAIEYGFLPYFSITAESIDLSNTDVYASQFSAIYKKIVETYNIYAELMEKLVDVPIVHHERSGNLAVVTYENGEKIVINYGEESVSYEGIKVDALSAVRLGKQEVKKLEEKNVELEEKGKQSRLSVYPALVIWLSGVLFVSIVVFGCISFFYRYRP